MTAGLDLGAPEQVSISTVEFWMAEGVHPAVLFCLLAHFHYRIVLLHKRCLGTGWWLTDPSLLRYRISRLCLFDLFLHNLFVGCIATYTVQVHIMWKHHLYSWDTDHKSEICTQKVSPYIVWNRKRECFFAIRTQTWHRHTMIDLLI